MNQQQYVVRKWITPPAAISDNATLTTTEIDTIGYNYATIVVGIGATDIAMGSLKVTESDTAGSGHADITGADFSVAPATVPSATDDNKFFVVNIDLRNGRKRYLDVTATTGNGTAGTYVCIWIELTRAQIAPVGAAALNADQVLSV